jgi:hypothetical protein
MRLMDDVQELLAEEVRQEIIGRRKAAMAAMDQAVESGDLVRA